VVNGVCTPKGFNNSRLICYWALLVNALPYILPLCGIGGIVKYPNFAV
jgi:hypothetical protein